MSGEPHPDTPVLHRVSQKLTNDSNGFGCLVTVPPYEQSPVIALAPVRPSAQQLRAESWCGRGPSSQQDRERRDHTRLRGEAPKLRHEADRSRALSLAAGVPGPVDTLSRAGSSPVHRRWSGSDRPCRKPRARSARGDPRLDRSPLRGSPAQRSQTSSPVAWPSFPAISH